jgi:hypothetical protein
MHARHTIAVEEDPRIRLPGSGSADDTSSTGSSASTDTGRSNRQQAVDEDPGIDVTLPSQVETDTTPDDTTSNRQAAVNADPAQQIDRINSTSSATGGSPPEALQDSRATPETRTGVREALNDGELSPAAAQAALADLDQSPATDSGEAVEADPGTADTESAGPSNAPGEFEDVRVGDDGTIELTRDEQQSQIRSAAALTSVCRRRRSMSWSMRVASCRPSSQTLASRLQQASEQRASLTPSTRMISSW